MRSNRHVPNHEKVERFLDAVTELSDHPYWQDDFTPSFNITFDRDKGWSYSVPEPDAIQLDSFVMRLRVFLSDDEPIFVNHIRNLVRPRLKSKSLVEDLDIVYDEWRSALSGGGIAINLNEKPVLSDEAWKLYVNSHFAHLDLDKRRYLERHAEAGSAWMIRWRFLEHVHHAAQYVIGVGIVVRQAIDQDELDLSF